MNNGYPNRTASAAAVMLLAVTLAGCQMRVAGLSAGDDAGGQASARNAGQGLSDSPQKAYDNKSNTGGAPVTGSLNGGEHADPNAVTESSAGGTSAPSAKTEEAWNAKAPKLFGIAIGEAEASASAKLGKPSDVYPLDDDGGTLSVKEYAACSVGFSPDKKVKFVEVFGRSAATGLGGLRVGDTASAAVKKLGQPGTHTGSVLAYDAEGALLKLDLDPDNERILSIKLFASAENRT
ncbi:hypothetical protein SAMN02799624_00035 [Paenibacillus sp. UNC496MF]|uniref:hypothetical protein n=1 Tax=Paenibacillus sp. UNC496MF TaxID=1502753 RepID=UPI0008E0CD20|nr:hypothetical protein [Paenibacillus sp. UNC496MF]SFI27298.1 hypothetical protein SAMN02799624_00035 [Paenibacillus sp. UNC496MF]